MKLEVEHLPVFAVISVKEGLDGEEAEKLVATVEELLEEGTRLFIVDLSEMDKADSGGLGCLVKAYAVVVERGGKLAFVIPSSFDDNLPLGIYRLLISYEVYRSREEAIDALLELGITAERIESLRRRATARVRFAYAVLLISVLVLLSALLL